ncbi:unnamed protein product [Hermetia illucens]|uniref:Uncharacterized protein n=1 Tax=Hermetia illucens TaxID=343691 RepID=A0A7R8UKP3_HERIL|nr:unnamed protein product [Hermetia illucens]
MINIEQDTIKSRINEIINEIEEASNHTNEHEQLIKMELHYEEFFSKINHKVEVTDMKIETFRDSLLFLQTGILDPFILKPEQLLEQLNKLQEKDNLTIHPLISNYQQLMIDLKLKAFIKENKVYVVISIDTVTEENFDLYEVLIFPYIKENNGITVENLPRYLIVSKDHEHYATSNDIDFKKGEQVNSVKDRLVELENCCFNLNLDDIKQNNVKINKLASDNIHELKDLTAEVAEQSNFWENNIKPLPKLMYENKWYITTFGTIIAIGIIYFVAKCCFRENAKFILFKKCFCRNKNNMKFTVTQSIVITKEKLEKSLEAKEELENLVESSIPGYYIKQDKFLLKNREYPKTIFSDAKLRWTGQSAS